MYYRPLSFYSWCVKSAKIFERGQLAMDLVPVKFVNESSEVEGAMYDLAGKKLLRN